MAAALLKGTAFITGAASGIGQHTAASFAKHGIQRLALADINTSLLATSAAALRKQYPSLEEVLELNLDVRSESQVREGITHTAQKFGRLDVAVNNAGIGGTGKQTHLTDQEEWLRVLDVNLNGVWRCQKAELGVMMGQEDLGLRLGRGKIINIASMYGLVAPGAPMYHAAYAASKHGVVGLTKADGNAYGPEGIRINAICPGYVKTPLLLSAMDQDSDSPLARDIRNTPLKRMADMEEIGDAVALMASPLAGFMQGAAVVFDGGFTTQ
ncbi:3-oxoacyl-reductase [Microdochium trichocladiopsis]|uniref:3-oxoacyl-reductase n=1 Tax=Microdochium trichocladiopsis TaxID=1682393 RepID=A0A9P9BJS3_9PEZI|nr:3-oxoacyl-reductase [Microdochium trichocladiopsis]KAH7018438.1 3-oxoacyl-reductase [Microdochium trichocladiopsis]